MKPLKGIRLSASQSVRLAMIQSVDPQRAIEVIAQHLRLAATGFRPGIGTPREWYGKEMRRRGSA